MNTIPLTTLNNMARQLLTSQPGNPIDKRAVESAVAMVAPIVSASSGLTFTQEDLAAVVRSLESLFVVEQGAALALKDRGGPRTGTSATAGSQELSWTDISRNLPRTTGP